MTLDNFIIQFILGFICADVLAGSFHWFEDNYLDYCLDIPIVGEIAKDNELHHYFPRSILAYSYLEHIYVLLPLSITIVGLLFIANPNIFYKYYIFFLSFFVFTVSANIFHRFSHMRECENTTIINVLQKSGILCSHYHHSQHHTKGTEKYCVLSEYTNLVLDTIGFWTWMEYNMYFITGILPKRKQVYNEYYPIHTHLHINSKLECPDTPTRKDVDELVQKLRVYKQCNI